MKLDTDSPAPEPTGHVVPPKFSKMAVFALVCAVIPCCPMVSLLGGVLGMFAFQRIRKSGGRLRGRRTAITAAMTGFVLSLASSIALNGLADYVEGINEQIMQERLLAAMTAAGNRDVAAARKQFAGDAQALLTDQSVEEVGKAAHDRYGKLQRFSMTSTTERGIFDRRMDVAGVFVFDRAQKLGSASFEIRATATQYWPDIRLVHFVIEDKDQGDLQLPAIRPPSP
jgi:hypothetical protein